MNKKFTKLIAALALLVFMMPSIAGWGQTRAEGDEITSISNIVSGNTYYIKGVRSNNTYYLTFTDAVGSQSGTESSTTSGAIPVTFTLVSGNTYTLRTPNGNYIAPGTSNGKINVSATAINVTATDQNSKIRLSIVSSSTTWSIQKNTSAANFGGYKNTQADITLIEAGAPAPSMSVSPTSIDFGNENTINPNEPYTRTFNVGFANLTQNLTVTGFSGVTVTPATINANATSPQTVTVSYNPTTAGSISGNISVNSSEVTEQLVAVTASAYDPANIPTYTLVSDAGSLHAGDVIILGCASKNAVAGEMGSNPYFTKVNATFTDGIVATNAAIQITLGGSAGAWTLTTREGQIGVSSANLNHNGEGTTTWTITISNNVAHINGGSNNGDIQYNASNPRFKTYTSSQTSIEIYKLVNENQVATPTFSVEAGTYLSAQSVSINCETDGAIIQYKTTENGEWQNYSTAINVSETTTIWARAIKTGMDESEIATATYTILIIEHAGTEADPYSVADARNLIDYGESYPEGVYATGIVCRASTGLYNNKYLSYYISADGLTESDQLEAYNGLGINGADFTSVDDVQVGDIVVIYGNLTKYNSTYEFNAGNQLVSLVRPAVPSITVTPNEVNVGATPDEEDFIEGTLTLTYENLTITGMSDFGIQYYDAEGEEIAVSDEPSWIEVLVAQQDPNEGEGYVVSYTILENDGAARTAYFKVYASWLVEVDGDVVIEGVYSNLVSITQAALIAIDLRGVTTPLTFNAGDFTSSGSGYKDYDDVTYIGSNGVYYDGWTLCQVMHSGGNMQLKASSGKVFMPTILTDYGFTITVQAETNSVLVGVGQNITDENSFTTTATSADVVIKTGTQYAVISNITITPLQTSASYTLPITAHTTNGGWNLIASPIEVNPANVTGMTDGNFDLYRFNGNPTPVDNVTKEWENWKQTGDHYHFDLVPGKGYLYANAATVDLIFSGTMATTLADVDLPYDGESEVKSLYLAGNSLQQATTFFVYGGDELEKQTVNFLTLNGNGDGFVTTQTNAFTAQAMQGFFVQNGGEGWFMSTFDLDAKSGTPELLNIMVNQNRGTLVDNAIVSFSDAPMMNKFYLNDNSTRVYIPQNGEEMAVVRSEAQGEMPVNFRAAENGTYTLSIDIENMDMNYLHLIDNMTGMDVDLLQTPSYTFNATTRDYESRFRLVFAANNEDGVSTGSTAFAFYSNGNWIINNVGDATLQVIDVTGRVLSSETVSGSVSKTINAVPGVYMLRLINGENVNVQKIVVR